MELTDSQKKAVFTIDKNIAVSAGAGSGKTRVLVERYLYILEKGNLRKGREIDSIVAITFTKKAAAEMKERVRRAVYKKIEEDEKWKRIYIDIERANISTIHSFCSKILRENPVEAGIDPNFALLEDYEEDRLLNDVIEEYITDGIENSNKVFELIKHFSASKLDGSSFKGGLISDIKWVYRKVRSTGIDFKELKRITLETIDNIKIDKELLNKIKYKFQELIDDSTKRSKLGKLADDEVWIDFKNNNFNDVDENILDTLYYLYKNIGTSSKEEKQKKIDELKGLIGKAFLLNEKKMINIYESFLDVLIVIDNKYTKEKKIRGLLDYEDLQIKLLNLLDNDNIRKRYQDRFRYIMVDEFQDTNELQKKIIYKLCSENSDLDRENLFIVGDPKQSIYAFRGADVDVFYDVVEDIKRISKESPISLKDNFRTMDTVMNFINDIFNKLMNNIYEELVPNRTSSNDIDVEILENENLEIPEGVSKTQYVREYESELIAKRIKQLVNNEGYNYNDIAILFRSMSDTHIYEKALKDYNIPYYNLGGKGFYNKQEILDIINGLKAINNKYDPLSIVAVLRSPMFGLSDKTIYWLIKNMEDNLISTLSKDIQNITEKEMKKVKKAYKILSSLNTKKYMAKIYDLIEELLDRTYYIETWMLKFGSRQAIANIYKFIEMAREFDKKDNNSIEDFIQYIDSKSDSYDEGQAQIESEEGNTVKIMTIHKSKGLEFKVVIVPQMAKRFNMNFSSILFDKDKGIAIKHNTFYEKDKGLISPLYYDLKEIEKKREKEENKRILYVAMTRAEDKLIIGNQDTDKDTKNTFREFIKDLIPEDRCVKIDSIDIEKDKFISIKTINKVDTNKTYENKFPLLKKFKEYGSKDFNRVSITQYMTFKECKRRFYMSYYRKIPIDTIIENETNIENYIIIDSATKGLVVHKICENYKKGINTLELIKSVLKSYNLKPSKEIIDEIKVYVDNYSKYHSEDYDKRFNEKSFYYKIQNKFIYGIIDRINIKGKEAEIVDFKTNKVENIEYIKKKYEPQIHLYSKVFKDIYKIQVKKAGLLLLETGDYVDIDISSHKVDNSMEDIKNFINYIDKFKNIKDYKKDKKNCQFCKFNKFCID
ncbi:UvrD-helicase domain-containing protein [Thermohalobacter berrensis]|uniref:DNA 3'-5' helicase n=1 Tax=Thermohalobacter berrensis TaxID=99594 RepID=A0A419T187_9FIRM|nr:UvrD-helicase domain-containing protein [Thermohalobacter berrensis]RKD31188.1 hypothetical protein BET03_03410 [Thermohalobacter berrensis]